MKRAAALLLAAALGAACGHDFEPPDRAERVDQAARLYSAALFDTVTWASDSARSLAGNEVYAATCRRCHGPLGQGGTDYARQRGLEVPSLVEPDWPVSRVDTLRRRIFVGHEEGMPTFGVAGISPREIDGAAFYLLYTLRPDVLGRGGG